MCLMLQSFIQSFLSSFNLKRLSLYFLFHFIQHHRLLTALIIFLLFSSTPAYVAAFGTRADTVPAFFIVTALDGRSVLRNDTRDIFASLVKKVNI